METGNNLEITAESINPEAGSHAVPDNWIELKAALDAARDCREMYPYYDARYGERGKRFCDSDAAWLAALVELPASEIIAQVEWLGAVLSSRGMPRITLEHQVTILYETLVAVRPERRLEYERLLCARDWLRGERNRYLAEEDFIMLVAEFLAATHGELDGAMQGMGRLLVSAVCDEKAGIPGAVASVKEWATDSGRFSAEWITAVRETLAHAKKYVSEAVS